MFNFNICPTPFHPEETTASVTLSGKDLTICDVVRVARFGAKVQLTDEKKILQRVLKSHDYIEKAVSAARRRKERLVPADGLGRRLGCDCEQHNQREASAAEGAFSAWMGIDCQIHPHDEIFRFF